MMRSRYVFPDFLNLGIAPPTPRGVKAVAPRVALVPWVTFAGPLIRTPRAHTPLLIPQFYLPIAVNVQGIPLELPSVPASPLTPNFYAGG